MTVASPEMSDEPQNFVFFPISNSSPSNIEMFPETETLDIFQSFQWNSNIWAHPINQGGLSI